MQELQALRVALEGLKSDASRLAAGAGQARDEARLYGIGANYHDDRRCLVVRQHRPQRQITDRHDDIDVGDSDLARQARQTRKITLGVTIHQLEVPADTKSVSLEARQHPAAPGRLRARRRRLGAGAEQPEAPNLVLRSRRQCE